VLVVAAEVQTPNREVLVRMSTTGITRSIQAQDTPLPSAKVVVVVWTVRVVQEVLDTSPAVRVVSALMPVAVVVVLRNSTRS
jgi:hypothetical protein